LERVFVILALRKQKDMKKIFITLFALLGFTLIMQAQTKPVLNAVIKTPNALCHPKDRIEAYLKRYDGVLEINVIWERRNEGEVCNDRTDIEQIKTAIANCGYDADDVPAAEDAYARLPKTCKKFEEGGGHPKPKVPPPPAQQ
jgi:hypothetical protein